MREISPLAVIRARKTVRPGRGLVRGSFKKADKARYIAGQYYMRGSFVYDPMGKARGWLSELDPSTAETMWKYQ